MLLASLRNIIDVAIAGYVRLTNTPPAEVYAAIGTHLAEMAEQHREDEPRIPYDNPLCRLSYLYMHVAATATLANRALKKLNIASDVVRNRGGQVLRVCAMGGGPGSEMLGLVKYFAEDSSVVMPSRLDFIVLDK